MAAFDAQHSLTDLLGSLVSDVTGLFRKEVQLAKAEASEKLDQALDASKGLAIGAVLAIGATGVLLAALVAGLAAILVAIGGMSEPTADFVAALVVGLVVGGIAWSFISKSIAAWKATRLNLNKTTHSLARDAQVVKESF
jgi:flagellar biosynthesis protein FliQ